MVTFFPALRRKARTLFWKVRGRKIYVVPATQAINLDQISHKIYHGCMGLPQELVDHIMDMLHDDIRTLKACSLVCKPMFASTSRHLKCRRLSLALSSDFLGVLARGGYPLHYTRQFHIASIEPFTPNDLLPRLHHFKLMDRVHTLTIDFHHASAWLDNHKTCFAHLYPTLTSLTLCCPSGHYRLILQFALQFPNLENLGIEWLGDESWPGLDLTVAPPTIDQYPPLRGRLRLAGIICATRFLADLTYAFPNGMNFQSIELEGIFGGVVGQMASQYHTHNLEDITLVLSAFGNYELNGLELAGVPALRRLTLRLFFQSFQIPLIRNADLLRALSTITSPVFREFVVEVDVRSSHPNSIKRRYRGTIDGLLNERFANGGEFNVIIRTGEALDNECFRRRAKEFFPLLTERGCVKFETSRALGRL